MAVGEELVGGSAAWPDDYRVVKGWSGGTAILQDALAEADDADRAKAGFFLSAGVATRGLGAADTAQRACAEGRRKRRLEHLRGDCEGPARRPDAGDDPDHGVCLGKDEPGAGERGTATRARVSGRRT